MHTTLSLRIRAIAAWLIAGTLVLGFFLPRIGVLTGPVVGTWFVGLQPPRRGFLWLLGLAVLLGLPQLWRAANGGLEAGLTLVGWTLVDMVLGILPFLFHRLTAPHLRGFLFTLPLPVSTALLTALQAGWPAADVAAAHRESAVLPLPTLSALLGEPGSVFLVCWLAATLVWIWDEELDMRKTRSGVVIFIAVGVLAVLLEGLGRAGLPGQVLLVRPVFDGMCLAATAAFALRALLVSLRAQEWVCRPDTLAVLRSPVTAQALRLARDGRSQSLVSATGEKYPVRGGIPDLRLPSDMTGSNGKYNQLYAVVGGLYDDIQRVVSALSGIDRDAYVMGYLGKLEVRPGDAVLETSVGTGLNFKYLPRGTSLTGIDLSPEMLSRCQSNLTRWQLDADLLLSNAERLPFADSSFDVVFHVGGINFFNDRARAVREMIRVARPGSLILIADETEEHVKTVYERGPLTSRYFRKRRQPVTAPVDLVPSAMLEKHLEVLRPTGKNRFYVLTFRKPPQAVAPVLGPAA
jgi:ubiquinone/menaquinone biosynthesis C-methylase UbiE